MILTQGFTISDTTVDRSDSLPFAVPDVVVQVYRQETDEPVNPESGAGEPFSFAGLDGYIERVEMNDPTTERGSRTEIVVFAAQGPFFVNIEAPFSTEDELRRFARSLSVPDADLSLGIESEANNTRLLLELPGDAGNGSNFYSRWWASYTTSGATDARPEASLSVESVSFGQLQLEIMRSRTRRVNYEPVPGTNYLSAQYEQPNDLVIEEGGNPDAAKDKDPEKIGRTSVLRYDSDAQTLVRLDLADDLAATIALMEQLSETDLDTWRDLVEPYNAKPLQPR